MPSSQWRLTIVSIAGALVLATEARAEHFNRIGFVPAFQPCTISTANVVTTAGVAACMPAVAMSDCATSPETALTTGERGRASVIYRASGRRETHGGRGVDFLVAFGARGIVDCSGEKYTGDLRLRFTMAQDRSDPACASGQCTLPARDLVATIPCDRGDCRRSFTASEIYGGGPADTFPQHHPFAIKFQGLDVLDRAGRPFLTEGVAFNSGRDATAAAMPSARPLQWLSRLLAGLLSPTTAFAYLNTAPQYAHTVLTRFTRAYEDCTVGDTTTGDGKPACAAVPLSDCRQDPANAVEIVLRTALDTLTGRAKVHLHIDDDEYEIRGNVDGLRRCDGSEFQGELELEWLGSVTLDDPACGGTECTTVPTAFFGRTLAVKDGESVFKGEGLLDDVGPFPGEARWAVVSRIRASILDRSGRPALTGPATLVRCSPLLDESGQPFCYSN